MGYAKFAIVSAQLDNMLENALYPVTMFNDAKSGCLFAASFSMRETGEINRFPEVRIVWAPSGLNVLIHEPLLWALKEYVDEIGIQRLFAEDGGDASEMSSKDSRMKNNDGKKVQSKAKKQKTVSTNLDRLVSVGTLTTDGIRAYVTLTSAPLSRPKNAPMMVCATLNLLRLDRLPIAIAPFSLPTNATLKLSDLRKKMKSHVIRQFTIQSGRTFWRYDKKHRIFARKRCDDISLRGCEEYWANICRRYRKPRRRRAIRGCWSVLQTSRRVSTRRFARSSNRWL